MELVSFVSYCQIDAPASGEGRHNRVEAWRMVQRRAEATRLDAHICNHTWRGTGITTYLENGGTTLHCKWPTPIGK
jgi:hypothetical protein